MIRCDPAALEMWRGHAGGDSKNGEEGTGKMLHGQYQVVILASPEYGEVDSPGLSGLRLVC